MFKNIKRGIKWSSSKSSYIQVLHQQIRGGGGSKSVLIALTQGGWGVQNYGKHADIILEHSLSRKFDIKQKDKCSGDFRVFQQLNSKGNRIDIYF